MKQRFDFKVWSPDERVGQATATETLLPVGEGAAAKETEAPRETGGVPPAEPATPATPTEPFPKALTPEDIEERAYRATQRAMAEIRAQDEQRQREAQAKHLETQRRANGQISPTQEALDALDLRQEMYEQALELHPDLPAEARHQLKLDLRNFRTLEALYAARDGKLHVKLADAAAGEAVRSGKYAPNAVQAPAREPIGGPKPAPGEKPVVPDGYRRQVASLGVTLTDEELLQAYEMDVQGGW